MTTDDYIRVQLVLECVGFNERGYMIRRPCENPDAIYRVLIVRDGEAILRYLRHDVPPDLRENLKQLPANLFFEQATRIQALLSEHAPCDEVFSGRTYVGTQTYPDDDAISIEERDSRCSMVVSGQRIASCSSMREDGRAAEAWVFVENDYRGFGYGKRVVKAWVNHIIGKGKIPFYSHNADNSASRHLADSIGLEHLYHVVGFV